MLGWIIAGLLFSAAVITICVAFLSSDVAKDKAKAECPNAVKLAIKKIDQAAAKGILHKNAAARKKSALEKTLNAAG